MPDPLANDRQWGNSALKSYNSSSITLCVDKDYLSSFWKTNFTNMWSQDESGWIRMNRGKSGWSRMNQDEADNFLLFWHIVAIGSSSVLYWSKSRREDIRQAFSCHDDWLISFSRDLEWSKSWEFSQRDSSKSPWSSKEREKRKKDSHVQTSFFLRFLTHHFSSLYLLL